MFDDHGLPGSKAVDMPPGSGDDTPSFRASTSPGAPARFGRLAICVAAAGALALGVIGTVAYGIWFNHDQQTYAAAMSGARQALGAGGQMAAGFTAGTSHPASVNTPSTGIAPSGDTRQVAAHPAAQLPAQSAAQSAAQPPEDSADEPRDPAKTLAEWSGQITPAAPASLANSTMDDPATFAALAAVEPDDAPPAATHANLRGTQLGAPAQNATVRGGHEARLAQQNRRAAESGARHKDSRDNLFARVSQFFRRVSYKQHGNTNQQDIYSHP
jgi:hypothetical protein